MVDELQGGEPVAIPLLEEVDLVIAGQERDLVFATRTQQMAAVGGRRCKSGEAVEREMREMGERETGSNAMVPPTYALTRKMPAFLGKRRGRSGARLGICSTSLR